MDRCPQHSTIGANSCFRPVPNPSRASLVWRQSNSAQAVCLWHRLFRVTVKNGLKNQSAGGESYAIGKSDRVGRAAAAGRAGHVAATVGAGTGKVRFPM